LARGIREIASVEPDRIAIVDGTRRITFRELDEGVNRVAHALRAARVEPGDRVAVMLQNRAEVFSAWNGAARVGATVVPVSYRALGDEFAYVVDDSGATAAIYDDSDVVVPTLADRNGLRAAWHVDDRALRDAPTDLVDPEYAGTAVVVMNYTSGTTGRPKGIERTPPRPAREYPPSLLAAALGATAADVHLLCGPAYHSAPGNIAQMSLGEGSTLVIMRRFDGERCLQLIQDERVTTTHMVPANFIRILEAPWREYDRSSMRLVFHGAAPCPPDVKRRIMEVFPPETITEYYAASEGMATQITGPEWLQKPGSVGRPHPGMHIAIRDDDGVELPPGEVGTIYVSAPPMMERFAYHNAPEKTSDAWRGDEFTVHDMGWLDDDGYLYIADRRVDLILRGGVNIYPLEIEHALATHPDVVDSAVFGLPEPTLGQRVHAIVELVPGSGADETSLLEHLRGQVALYKLPTSFEFVDELPREPSGKVRKHQLREARMNEPR
jgi:long-chain acyl-CoA synthetase